MNKRIRNYLKQINNLLLTEKSPKEWKALAKEHLIQISFFQHERLIHLLVTLCFAIMTVGTVLAIAVTGYVYLGALFILLMILLVPYVWHYFVLENGVQKMYKQYDEMIARSEGKKEKVSKSEAKKEKAAKNEAKKEKVSKSEPKKDKEVQSEPEKEAQSEDSNE